MNDISLNTNQWLHNSTARLEQAGIATARLDCLVLLEDALSGDRAWILAHQDQPLDVQTSRHLNAQVKRREKHEPLAYIRGKTEFYGREFAVNHHTLEPRPETEDMIDLLKEIAQPDNHIVDIGTGSGAIGITAALELHTDKVELTDIDQAALKIARQNLQKYGLSLVCKKADLLINNQTSYDIVLANLPYVPDSHTINEAAMQEPKHAIFGGVDGLELYRGLFQQVKSAYVLTESLPPQHKALAGIAQASGYQQIRNRGFIQVFEASA